MERSPLMAGNNEVRYGRYLPGLRLALMSPEADPKIAIFLFGLALKVLTAVLLRKSSRELATADTRKTLRLRWRKQNPDGGLVEIEMDWSSERTPVGCETKLTNDPPRISEASETSKAKDRGD